MDVEPELLKLLEGTGVGKMLSGTLPAQKVRRRIDKWDLIKLKRFVEPREQLFERRGSPDSGRVLAS